MAKSKGRMIRCDISLSQKIALLSPEALAMFCLLIPWFNPRGKMNGDLYFIKGQVCPLIPWFTLQKIESCLEEISEKTNVKRFKHNGLYYLQSLNWKEHQDLKPERLGPDTLPSYQGQEYSRQDKDSSRQLPLEVEEEVEVRSVRMKREGKSAPMARPSLDDVKAYFNSNNFDPLEAEHFYDFYQSNGWYVGKRPMKDWQATVRNWIRRAPGFGGNRGFQPEKKASPRRYIGVDQAIAKRKAAENTGTAKTET